MNQHTNGARRVLTAMLAALLAVGLISGVSAHEHREVEGFEFTVGFMNEPAYVNELNGIDLRIARVSEEGHDDEQAEDEEDGHDDSNAVENAHENLDALIIFGEETLDVELRPVWGQPGAYTADVIPTATGAYSFQFTGEIEGVEINETFRAGPDTFSEVEGRDGLEFPTDPPTRADETDQAAAFGIAGVAAGLLGLIAGGAAYYKVSNATPQQGSGSRSRQRQQPAE